MLFASSKDALRRALVGIGAEIQATDPSEVAHEVGAYPVHPSRSLRSTLIVFVGQFWTRSAAKSPLSSFTHPRPLGHSHHSLPLLTLLGLFVYCTPADVVELKLNQLFSHHQNTERTRYTRVTVHRKAVRKSTPGTAGLRTQPRNDL
jgi:hypothetical protein